MNNNEHKFTWSTIDRTLRVIEFLVILLGIGFTLFQVKDILNNQNGKENSLILQYEDRLGTGTNNLISIAIERNQPLLKNGKFSTDDLDNYIGTIESIGTAYQKNLINDDSIYENFNDVITKAYKNQEIQNYLTKIRLENKTYFQGFDDISLHELQENQDNQ